MVITVRILQGGLADGRTANVTFTTADGFGLSGEINYLQMSCISLGINHFAMYALTHA